MKFNKFLKKASITGFLLLLICACSSPIKNQQAIDQFIQEMADKHGFKHSELAETLAHAEINEEILNKIASPSEGLPWHKYRKLFLTRQRIDAGVAFWRDHKDVLRRAEQIYGAPASIITAILGIETNYGKKTGNYPVLDALYTLAFAYPPRSRFFRSELENFLLLCRDERLNPSVPLGSYAGAMGMPQFMPSSYIHYAIDFNKDNKRDIWTDPEDAIASIGNYFAAHGWRKGEKTAAKFCETSHKTPNEDCFLKENLRKPGLESPVPKITNPLLLTEKAEKLALEQEDGKEIWAVFHNFHVITRYNKSPLYAMAVFQLSLALSNQIYFTSYEPNHNDILRPARERLLE